MQFGIGYPNLIRLSIFEIKYDPDPVLNWIRLDRDSETGSCSSLPPLEAGRNNKNPLKRSFLLKKWKKN